MHSLALTTHRYGMALPAPPTMARVVPAGTGHWVLVGLLWVECRFQRGAGTALLTASTGKKPLKSYLC